MIESCTEARFLNDVKNHNIKILQDSGVARHISFTNNGSSIYRFDLITWPGHLCIAGDCGTYVFSRINDMFEFFRTDQSYKNQHPEKQLFINKGYWGQKLESIGTNAGYREFCEESFTERVKEYFDMHFSDHTESEEKDELWNEIEFSVLSRCADGEHFAYDAVYNFESNGFKFHDFFDGGGTERYTFNYLWCLYAIVYGIEEYDKHKLAFAA